MSNLYDDAILTYVLWCFSPEICDLIPNWSINEIQQNYFNSTSIFIDQRSIKRQIRKWRVINDDLYRVTPKNQHFVMKIPH